MAARTPSSPKSNEELILYRLSVVEKGVDNLNGKLEKLNIIKPSDLEAFQDRILTRLGEIKDDLEDKVAAVDKRLDSLSDSKADKSEIADMKKLIGGVAAIGGTVIGGLLIAYFTRSI